jgi:ArsR family transcriptional regulator
MTAAAVQAVATDQGPGAATTEHWQHLASRLQAFAEPTRLRLLAALRTRPNQQACVKELTAATGLAQPLVSHHLQILRRALLVNSTRHGSHVYYQLDASVVQATAQELTRAYTPTAANLR